MLAGARLPVFLDSAISYAGDITSPLALILVGILLHRSGLKSIKRIDKPLAISLVGRFVLSPLVMYLVAVLFGAERICDRRFCGAERPPRDGIHIIFGGGTERGYGVRGTGVGVTTLLSFATIPIYIAILGM